MTTEMYYTLEEAAQVLKLHPQTLRRWIREGKLPARRFGRQFRLRPDDLERAAQPAQADETEEHRRFEQLALAGLMQLWDNEEDAVYDDWQKLYGVAEG
jgi:excisionase family DNA binding protein